jgi:hypothetical protein
VPLAGRKIWCPRIFWKPKHRCFGITFTQKKTATKILAVFMKDDYERLAEVAVIFDAGDCDVVGVFSTWSE